MTTTETELRTPKLQSADAPLQPVADFPVTIIEPTRGRASLKLHELWERRELYYFLTWRDLKVRYKQTVLGSARVIIQPFFALVVFSIFFGTLAKMPSDSVPYLIFAYAAKVYSSPLAVPMAIVFLGAPLPLENRDSL